MYWGYSLLVWDEVFEPLLSGLAYTVWSAIPKFLYTIWKLIAWVVSQIEGIFKNLAGLGGENTDMVTSIINHPAVQQIFGNLVGFATALIVFFTIVKIIQEHYKEKDGGNPYKIIVRTFKGLLMFFFVQGAVTIGLVASQTIFRALDAATGTGSMSIAGQVFKAMAADANRRNSPRSDGTPVSAAMNEYWDRVNNQSTDKGNYFVVQMTGNNKAKTSQALKTKYVESFPILRYGVVNQDGTVTPATSLLNTFANEKGNRDRDEYWDRIGEDLSGFYTTVGSGNTSWYNESGSVAGSVGFKSDLLQGINLTVTPTISLTWSPIDITDYEYALKLDSKVESDVDVKVMGNGVLIKMGMQYVKYALISKTQKSLEDSAKVFGISINGGVGLQGGQASASFSIDTPFDEKFSQILQTILVNTVYTNAFQVIIEMIPKFPGEFNIAAMQINIVQILGPLVASIFKESAVQTFRMMNLIPKDEKGNELVEVMSVRPFDHNSGIWSTVNGGSKDLTVGIEQYRIDGNFGDLWGQLVDNYLEFVERLESTSDDSYQKAADATEEFGGLANRTVEQSVWFDYQAKVNSYNDTAARCLTNLGNLLRLRDDAVAQTTDDGRQSILNNRGYNGNIYALDREIKENWVTVVNDYNFLYNRKPRDRYADPRIVGPVYKPIAEFNTTNNRAADMGIDEIKASLFSDHSAWSIGGSNGNHEAGDVKVNLAIDDNESYGNAGAYRLIDWLAYGPMYTGRSEQAAAAGEGGLLTKYADIYADQNWYETYDSKKVGKPTVNGLNSLSALRFVDMKKISSSDYNQQGGISYFIDKAGSVGYGTTANNDWYQHSSACNVFSKHQLGQGFWGDKGIFVPAEKDKPIFHYYEGTSYMPGKEWGMTFTHSVNPSSIRTSSANANMALNAGLSKQSELFNLMTMDTSTAKATEFAKNIVTFRELGTSDGDVKKDKKTLQEWLTTKPATMPNGDYKTEMIWEMSPEKINDLMASNGAEGRCYLLKSNNTPYVNKVEDWGGYIGQFSWWDGETVNALYDVPSINFAVGFIAIIAAVGVYLNFAFGLIQRVVNMAVLYVMSPVTIAFYPFDDGKRFTGSFVTPFYKEAISAFAVIISLNLFVVLMQPVEQAVATATGAKALGWLSLVAFVSMLPKIRDSITSILGAGSLSEKSLTDAFKGFKSSMMPSDLKNAWGAGKKGLKSAAHASAKIRNAVDAHKVKLQSKRDKELSHLNQLKAENKLGWWGEHRLNKLNAQDSMQKRIDEARASGDNSKLSKRERRRLKRQNEAATQQAKAAIKREDYKSDAEYEKAVSDYKNNLLNDANFKRSVNGVMAAKHRFSNTGFAKEMKAIGNRLNNSVIGEMVEAKLGMNGELSQNKDSFWGEVQRWRDKAARADNMGKIKNEFLARERKRYDHFNVMSDVSVEYRVNKDKANYELEKTVDGLTNSRLASMSDKDKYIALKTKEWLNQGKDLNDAKTLATDDANAFKGNFGDAVSQMGGDKALFDDLHAQFESELNQKKNLGTGGIEAELNKAKEKRENNLTTSAQNLGKLLDKTSTEDLAKIKNVLSHAKSSTSLDQLADKLGSQLGMDVEQVKNLTRHDYEDVHSKLQINDNIELLTAAKKSIELDTSATKVVEDKLAGLAFNDKNAVMTALNNANDMNLHSTNKDSVGYKLNQELANHNGDVNNPEYIKAAARIKQEAMDQCDAILREIATRNEMAIRGQDIINKTYQEFGSTRTMSTYTGYMKQREAIMSDEMDPYAHKLLVNDSMIRDMHSSGNYAGAGEKMKMVVEAVRRHDDEAISKLGFDQKTVETLNDWVKQGLDSRLDGIYKLGTFDHSFLSDGSYAMGGDTLNGVASAMTNVLRMAELKNLSGKFEVMVKNQSDIENSARNMVTQIRSEIESSINENAKWTEDLLNGAFKDASGKAINNAEELAAAVSEAMRTINEEGNDKANKPWIKDLLNGLNKAKSDHGDDYGAIGAIDNVLKGFDAAKRANIAFENSQNAQADKNSYDAMWRKIVNEQMKGQSGSGK